MPRHIRHDPSLAGPGWRWEAYLFASRGAGKNPSFPLPEMEMVQVIGGRRRPDQGRTSGEPLPSAVPEDTPCMVRDPLISRSRPLSRLSRQMTALRVAPAIVALVLAELDPVFPICGERAGAYRDLLDVGAPGLGLESASAVSDRFHHGESDHFGVVEVDALIAVEVEGSPHNRDASGVVDRQQKTGANVTFELSSDSCSS